MPHTEPARRLAIATGLMHTAAAAAGASAAFTAGHSTIAGIVIAAAGILPTGIAALAREWFWLRALRQPSRNLYRLAQLTGSINETEELMRLLQAAENNVLTARAAASRPMARQRHGSC